MKRIVVCFLFLLISLRTGLVVAGQVEELKKDILSLSLSEKGAEVLIQALEETTNLARSDKIDLYLELVDYYLGEAPDVILAQQISLMGNDIFPYLVGKKNENIECMEEFKSICRTFEERKRFIDWIMVEINKGRVVYQIFPDDLKVEALQKTNIIKIFVNDYRLTFGNFPSDLSALQAYAWEKYKYKLIIYNPWGELFDYNIVNGGQGFSIQFGEGGPED